MLPEPKLNLDTLGVGASALCLVHCVAFPVVIATVPTMLGNGEQTCASSPASFWIHLALLAAIAPIGVTAWGLGYRRHKDASILLLGVVGVMLLVAALVFGHHLMDGRGEQVITMAGSIAIVTAHLLNQRQCRCTNRCRCNERTARPVNVPATAKPVPATDR